MGRTFIKPTQKERESAVRVKLNVIEPVVRGKRIVLVDDSIVRGTTIANLIHMLKKAGALSVHVRVASPPFLHPCYFGTDVPSNDQLIACSHNLEEIRDSIGADSLGYMKIEDLPSMVGDLPLCWCLLRRQLSHEHSVIAETVLRFSDYTYHIFLLLLGREKRLPWIGSRFSGEIIILSCL